MSFPGADELANEGWPITVERLKEVFGDKQFNDSSKLLQTLLDVGSFLFFFFFCFIIYTLEVISYDQP